MQLDMQHIKADTCYHLMTQTIMPRPVAWVLSQNEDAGLNLAPFSFFNAVCSDPPLVMLSVGSKPDGAPKDTRRNLISGREFVIHLPSVAQAEAVTASAATLAYGESELPLCKLRTVDFPGCPLPRLEGVPIAFHARLHQVHYLGNKEQAVIYAELLQAWLDDAVITEDTQRGRYLVDASAINPLARLGGAEYATLGEVFKIKRPD
ncbi:flavin reductase family protein [Marinospirillum alkaliphilum]|uniref:NADH-FMN oxidoreductase RutF, flavin reductase (DIM6/NTAB) family n=1 Tax=Marinospirillum alkaliphilum DSM 21637 TaxID=1122209 RepID=A0A1K1ZVD3_9GAMM|nr:flavin reductase family protein [Marinospirillum alkaliphilum]SFX77405.1 NADH-FMN oxidoreductase RutF, flavin reductase (DIM6/NTAB) family [Marinospirillum alkaliphilum DSM 21637]